MRSSEVRMTGRIEWRGFCFITRLIQNWQNSVAYCCSLFLTCSICYRGMMISDLHWFQIAGIPPYCAGWLPWTHLSSFSTRFLMSALMRVWSVNVWVSIIFIFARYLFPFSSFLPLPTTTQYHVKWCIAITVDIGTIIKVGGQVHALREICYT